MYCVTHVICNRKPYIVIGSSAGVQIWCSEGNDMKFFMALGAMLDKGETPENHYIQCIGSCDHNHVAVGCSNGSVFVLEVPQDTEKITLDHNLKTNNRKNCCLCWVRQDSGMCERGG